MTFVISSAILAAFRLAAYAKWPMRSWGIRPWFFRRSVADNPIVLLQAVTDSYWLFGFKENQIMAMDPVCHMEVDESTAQWTSEYNGQTYYFCAPGCKASFDKDPEKYLGSSEKGHEHHH